MKGAYRKVRDGANEQSNAERRKKAEQETGL